MWVRWFRKGSQKRGSRLITKPGQDPAKVRHDGNGKAPADEGKRPVKAPLLPNSTAASALNGDAVESFSKPPSGRGAFPSAVKADCEVDWSDGKGECWDE